MNDLLDQITALRAERDQLRSEANALRVEVFELREKAREDGMIIGNERRLSLSLLAERDELRAKVDELEAEATRLSEHATAIRAQRDQLRARVAEVTCPECGAFVGMSDHDMDCETGHALDKKMGIELQGRMKNKAAIQALVDGRALEESK